MMAAVIIKGPIGIEPSHRATPASRGAYHVVADSELGTWPLAVKTLIGPRLAGEGTARQRQHARELAAAALEFAGEAALAAQVREQIAAMEATA